MFRIQSITACSSNYLGDSAAWLVTVRVIVEAKAWTKLRDKRDLGQLYGVDISNAVYRINKAIPASCPVVNDSARASKGFKSITLEYRLTNADHAESLGLKVHRYKNGSVGNAYADRVSIAIPDQVPTLKLVSNQ